MVKHTNSLTFHLCSTLSPLSSIKSQSIITRLKLDLTTFREMEHISRNSMDCLPSFVRDVKGTFKDDLHLVVGVGVEEGSPLFETVEA